MAHKILIPLVLLLTAGAAAPFFLLPYDKLSHTCTDPMKVTNIHELETESEKFTVDLYSILVTVFTYVLPVGQQLKSAEINFSKCACFRFS